MTRPTLPSRLRPLGPQAHEPAEIRQLRADLARKTKLVEDTLLSLDNLISPLDWQDAGFGGSGSWRWARPVDRTMDRTHAPLNYLNEQEWRWALAQARDLVQRNHLALGFRDHVANFIGPVDIAFVLRGQSPGATASGPADADGTEPASVHPLVRACTQVWDEWREWADWGQGTHDREAECRRRLIVEGECTLRFFAGDARSDGLPHVRHVEPERIRTPPGHSPLDRHGWGVITGDDDDEDELGLWVCHYQNVSEGKEVPSSEYVRIKGNVDRTVKRGWSDFNPVGEQLRKMMGLLDNVAHVARLQAAIAWWEEYPTATMQQVSSMIYAGQDYARTKLPPSATGADQSVTNYEAGTVVRTEGGREVKPGPVSAPNGFAQVEQMVLRGIGFRWGCPSYFSGDSRDSFASVLVTGSPFVRITESRQEEVKGFARKVACRVLEFAERTGRLPRGASGRVRPVATARPVVMADEEKQARTFLSLYEKSCADPVEFIRKRGGDPKVVAANIAAWQKKFAPPQQPGGDVPGGGLAPSGPAPAPPGSAGGDGSSPNAEPVGEGRWFREETDHEGNPMPTTPAGDGLKWELRDEHRNGGTVKVWHRVKAGSTETGSTGTWGSETPDGAKQTDADTFDSAAAAQKLLNDQLLPSDGEIEKIRKDGAAPSGRNPSKGPERRWERAIAVMLGPGWQASEKKNSADDVTGSVTINGVDCPVIVDGKLSGAAGFSYGQEGPAVRNKLDAASAQPNTIVAFLVAHVTPEGHDGSVASDGVTLRIGVHPQNISWDHDSIKNAGEFGPFQVLTATEYHALRKGDAAIVEKFRSRVFEKLKAIDIDKYNTAQTDASEVQTGRAATSTSQSASTSIKLGADVERVGKNLAKNFAALPTTVKVVQIGATAEELPADEVRKAAAHLSPKQVASLEHLLAEAKAHQNAQSGPNPPPS
ncbi:phage portal protein [Frigoriglobus tundricola]|uniref:Phage portal protein n=1 Tax=Frigoriglobus tundricola TaxID=2774151 RepID=A0A6M5YYY6_9BACT|nr:phage portal protein [Frigoriglobus tundricola]QJW98666.1 hypothetical protein FTUN_6261 [Frigoriglobus tundricola]